MLGRRVEWPNLLALCAGLLGVLSVACGHGDELQDIRGNLVGAARDDAASNADPNHAGTPGDGACPGSEGCAWLPPEVPPACEGWACLGPARLAAGTRHGCALLPRGTIECWGDLAYGAEADEFDGSNLPYPVALSFDPVMVTSGAEHACAVSAAGTVECWGKSRGGRLGSSAVRTVEIEPVLLSDLDAEVVAAAAGGMHTCAVDTYGSAYCWGVNARGQLGTGDLANAIDPRQLALGSVRQLAAGYEHTCALNADGAIFCWGANDQGQLGNGTHEDALQPTRVALDAKAVRVAAGRAHTCAVVEDGTVWCWGTNHAGELGDGSTEQRSVPTPTLPLEEKAIDVAAGGEPENPDGHTCALRASGGVSCWGSNTHGQTGATPGTNSLTPVSVIDGDAWQIALGAAHGCALKSDDSVVCWGDNAFQQLGSRPASVVSDSPLPVAVYGIPEVDPLQMQCIDPAYVEQWSSFYECECTLTCGPLERCEFGDAGQECAPVHDQTSIIWSCDAPTADGRECRESGAEQFCPENTASVSIGGEPAIDYDVTVRVAGVIGSIECTEGTDMGTFVRDGHGVTMSGQRIYEFDGGVLNCRPQSGAELAIIDFEVHRVLRGGGFLEVYVRGPCGTHLRNCVDSTAEVCVPYGVPGYEILPEQQALFIEVLSATPARDAPSPSGGTPPT